MLDREEYVQWSDPRSGSSLLWLRGGPGTGKTNLVSIVVTQLTSERTLDDKLLNVPQRSTKEALAYFYCSRTVGDDQRQNPRDILNSIARQLAIPLHGGALKSPVVEKYDEEEKEGRLQAAMSIKDSKLLVRTLIENEYSNVSIVIDALDEIDPNTRTDLFEYLNELVELTAGNVKVFVSSRNEPDIFESFETSSNLLIDATDNAEDIERFVKQEIPKRLLGGKANPDLRNRVQQILCDKAQGM